jgi:two-component system nitrate/nitrite response regulator NarL
VHLARTIGVDGWEEGAMETTVAVAERHEVVRRGLEAMLGSLAGVTWHSFASLEEMVAAPGPLAEVCLVDVGALRAATPGQRDALGATRVLAMIPAWTRRRCRWRCRPPRATGLLPDLSTTALRQALADVVAGRRHLPDRLSSFLLSRVRTGTPEVSDRAHLLTPREPEVLELLVAGLSNKEISRGLGISLHAAKRHVSSILSKLNSPSRSHAVSTVLRAGAWDRVPAPAS